MTCPHCGDETCNLGFECPKAKPALHMLRDIGDRRARESGLGAFYVDPASFVDKATTFRRPGLVDIGKHSNIDAGFFCTTALYVGDYCHVAPGCIVIGGASGRLDMHHFSTLGAGSRVVTASEEYEGLYGPTIPAEMRKVTSAPVVFEAMASVTTACIILPGVRLGMGCVVGAGAVVLKSTEPWGVYVGNPARKIGERPREKCLKDARALGYEFGGGA